MHKMWLLIIIPSLVGCVHRPVDGRQRVQDFRDWMTSDPASEVRARTPRGMYSFLGIGTRDAGTYWVPGITAKTNTVVRHDVEYQGPAMVDSTDGAAEEYMREFNLLMLEERRGVVLDIYGHSPAHRYFIEQPPAR